MSPGGDYPVEPQASKLAEASGGKRPPPPPPPPPPGHGIPMGIISATFAVSKQAQASQQDSTRDKLLPSTFTS